MGKRSISKQKCVVLGGGGHARVLIDCIQASRGASLLGVLDADPRRWKKEILGCPILGRDGLLPGLIRRGANCFVVGVGGVGDNGPRRRLFEWAISLGLKPLTIIHPAAVCSRWARVGPGAQLLPGSVVNAGAVLGRNVLVNSGAVVEHDCVLGDHVHVASGACLASAVTVGEGAHIGLGAAVRQGLSIGARAVVGAGAVVVKDVKSGRVVAGVPAKILKRKRR